MKYINSDGDFMINAIEEYIKNGETSENRIGIELEHFVVDGKTGENIPYSGDKGVESLLLKIADGFDRKIYSEGFLIGLSNSEYSLTLEPAAQLEISIRPVEKISEAKRIYEDFLNTIRPALDGFGYELVTEGYRHNCRAEELELIPKNRYRFMDRYFEHSGTCGKNMMRATASTQISIDYANEADCALKFRVANILSPIFALVCDNSHVFENEPYKGRMLRTYIWNNVDGERCGIVPCAAELTYKKYAEYILNRSAILIMKDKAPVYTGSEKIKDIYKSEMTQDEAEHLLSMFFPDVRLKKYIEIRPADSMPINDALSYAALVKGIFKNPSVFDFDGVTVKDIENAKTALVQKGFDAEIYGRRAYDIYEDMLNEARRNLSAEDAEYLIKRGESNV